MDGSFINARACGEGKSACEQIWVVYQSQDGNYWLLRSKEERAGFSCFVQLCAFFWPPIS